MSIKESKMSIKASKTFKSIQRASIYSKKLKSIKKLDYIDTFFDIFRTFTNKIEALSIDFKIFDDF